MKMSDNISNEEQKEPFKHQLKGEKAVASKKVRFEHDEELSSPISQEATGQVTQWEGHGSSKALRNRLSGNAFRNRGHAGNLNHSQGKDEFYMEQRLQSIAGPTLELDSIDYEEFPYSNRNRLYVGNMPSDMGKEKLKAIFKPFGDIDDIFNNPEKNFTFVKVDLHENAVKAKRALDGSVVNGRSLRVRFAPSQSIVRVRNLSRFVSNELLRKSFEIFGTIERAVVLVDERGNHKGEGIVEYAMRSAALQCLRFCHERCYYLTAQLRPCVVEPMEINDDHDGLPEKMIGKSQPGFNSERAVGPRFAEPGSFEHEYGNKWKRLYANYNNMKTAIQREFKLEEQKLEEELDYARTMRETELLREELREREADAKRRKLELQMRHQKSQQLILLETASPIHNQSDTIQRFSLDRPTGFGSICDYDARNRNLGNPFVVFGDQSSDKFSQDEIDHAEALNMSDTNYNSGSDNWSMGQLGSRRSLD